MLELFGIAKNLSLSRNRAKSADTHTNKCTNLSHTNSNKQQAQLDSGKLESFPRETREKQNGAPNTLWFPWKLQETQSAGDPLVSLWVAGNSSRNKTICAVQHTAGEIRCPVGLAAKFFYLFDTTRDASREYHALHVPRPRAF